MELRIKESLRQSGLTLRTTKAANALARTVEAHAMATARERFRSFFLAGRVPLWIKLLYTLFIAILVLFEWIHYSPVNLLWFCGVALVTTLVGLWLESGLLISMQALAVVMQQLAWQIDFWIHLATGAYVFGFSNYMFDPNRSLFLRSLSLFHIWMPYLLLWLLWRLGYDRRALIVQTLYAWVIFLLSYVLTKDMYGPVGNLNDVYGLSQKEPQTWMPPWLWLGLLMVLCPVCIYVPTHFFYRWFFRPPKTVSGVV